MIKKEHIIPVVIAILSVAFVTISLLLYFNKNNRWLVARKIKLGALMLTMTTTIMACSSGEEEVIMCYDSAYVDTLTENIESDTIDIIELPDTNQNIEVYD